VDYLAEALRDLRKLNFTETIDHHFSLGSHLNARDRKAVRRTVSGLTKILHPDGDVSKHDMERITVLAVEGRRRVKEQLKKMGSFEYYQTSFSYLDNDSGEEIYVGVPEQGGQNLISQEPLAPGTLYSGAVSGEGTVGLYRLEVTPASGTGKLKLAGGVKGAMKESIQRAFSFLQANKMAFGIGREMDTMDLHVEAIDLLGNKVEAEVGTAFVVAAFSALRRVPPQAGLLVLGDISIQGNIKPVRSLVEPLQVAMDNGAKRALIPIENKRNFFDVSAVVLEAIDPIFYGDARQATFKALGVS
jgi:ATP-dependent Lon protease